MAGTDPQKQLLTLIRGFASEKSHGERRIVDLKNRVEDLRSEIEGETAELEEAKRFRETTEQELKGYEVELAMNEATIQALEARISSIQDEISIYGSKLEALKNEDSASRDEFINKMVEFNTKIRKFQETMSHDIQGKNFIGTSLEAGHTPVNIKVTLKSLEDNLATVLTKTTMEEEEYQTELNVKMQVQQELIDLEKKVSLMEAIMKETKELQELTRQSSELEQVCASLGEELQRRSMCPCCHLDNVEALGGILQAFEAS